MTVLLLKRASASRSSGEGNDDDFDVLADGAVVDRILKVHAALVGTPWTWTLAFGGTKIARRRTATLRRRREHATPIKESENQPHAKRIAAKLVWCGYPTGCRP